MVATLAPARCIEQVPASVVSILADEGKLPLPPSPPKVAFGYRRPNQADIASLSWMVSWEGWRFNERGDLKRAQGVLGYRDGYDWHTCSDVREIVYISGSPRAIFELVDRARSKAREQNRRCIGFVDSFTPKLHGFLSGMGGVSTRKMIEDAV